MCCPRNSRPCNHPLLVEILMTRFTRIISTMLALLLLAIVVVELMY